MGATYSLIKLWRILVRKALIWDGLTFQVQAVWQWFKSPNISEVQFPNPYNGACNIYFMAWFWRFAVMFIKSLTHTTQEMSDYYNERKCRFSSASWTFCPRNGQALPTLAKVRAAISQGRGTFSFSLSKSRKWYRSKVERNQQHMFLNIHKGWKCLTPFVFSAICFCFFSFHSYATAANENNHTITQVK